MGKLVTARHLNIRSKHASCFMHLFIFCMSVVSDFESDLIIKWLWLGPNNHSLKMFYRWICNIYLLWRNMCNHLCIGTLHRCYSAHLPNWTTVLDKWISLVVVSAGRIARIYFLCRSKFYHFHPILRQHPNSRGYPWNRRWFLWGNLHPCDGRSTASIEFLGKSMFCHFYRWTQHQYFLKSENETMNWFIFLSGPMNRKSYVLWKTAKASILNYGSCSKNEERAEKLPFSFLYSVTSEVIC